MNNIEKIIKLTELLAKYPKNNANYIIISKEFYNEIMYNLQFWEEVIVE